MQFGFIIPAAIWLAAFWTLAAVLIQASAKARKEGRKSQHLLWLVGATLAMGGAAVPAAIQFMATGGKEWWAGAPLGFIALALAFQSIRAEKPKGPAFATFREKTAAVGVAATLLVYGWATWSIMQRPPELADVFGLLIGTGILMAIVMTLTLTVLAILRPPEKEDERDREVSLRATRNGYWAMATGMWAVAALIVAQPPPAVLVYALLGVFVLAELVRDVSQLVYYRLAV